MNWFLMLGICVAGFLAGILVDDAIQTKLYKKTYEKHIEELETRLQNRDELEYSLMTQRNKLEAQNIELKLYIYNNFIRRYNNERK